MCISHNYLFVILGVFIGLEKWQFCYCLGWGDGGIYFGRLVEVVLKIVFSKKKSIGFFAI